MPQTRLRVDVGLTDLTVLLVMAAILATVIAPAWVMRLGTTDNRVKCASNLRQIGQALLLYADENGGSLPFTRYEPGAPPTAYTGAMAVDPFGMDGPESNDVTAALFLLVRTQDIGTEVFICPSGPAAKWNVGNAYAQRSNFPGEQQLSYSFNNFYAPSAFKYPRHYYWKEDKSSLSPDFAIAADMNPGTPELLQVTPDLPWRQLAKANSYNHDQDAQNVLYGDGHVEFPNTPFVGIKQDNIYTAGSGASAAIVAPPAHAEDSILLPVASGAPAGFTGPSPPPQRYGIWIVLSVIVIVILLAIGWYALVGRRLESATAQTSTQP